MSIQYIYGRSTYSYGRAYQLGILILAVEEVLKWIRLLGTKIPVCRYRGWKAAAGTVCCGVEPPVANLGGWGTHAAMSDRLGALFEKEECEGERYIFFWKGRRMA